MLSFDEIKEIWDTQGSNWKDQFINRYMNNKCGIYNNDEQCSGGGDKLNMILAKNNYSDKKLGFLCRCSKHTKEETDEKGSWRRFIKILEEQEIFVLTIIQ